MRVKKRRQGQVSYWSEFKFVASLFILFNLGSSSLSHVGVVTEVRILVIEKRQLAIFVKGL